MNQTTLYQLQCIVHDRFVAPCIGWQGATIHGICNQTGITKAEFRKVDGWAVDQMLVLQGDRKSVIAAVEAFSEAAAPMNEWRWLVSASSAGAVIGHRGVVIKSIQERTGARIHISPRQRGSPYRVICIKSESASVIGAAFAECFAVLHPVSEDAKQPAAAPVVAQITLISPSLLWSATSIRMFASMEEYIAFHNACWSCERLELIVRYNTTTTVWKNEDANVWRQLLLHKNGSAQCHTNAAISFAVGVLFGLDASTYPTFNSDPCLPLFDMLSKQLVSSPNKTVLGYSRCVTTTNRKTHMNQTRSSMSVILSSPHTATNCCRAWSRCSRRQ
jgi:hypothetical protein